MGHRPCAACCKGVVNGPFAVINADDFYGRTAFSEIYDFLAAQTDESKYAMVGYRLKNTVTEFGSVARGVCEVENGLLTGVTERTKIFKRGQDAAYTEDDETFVPLAGDSLVSMNFWGFTPQLFGVLEERFPRFLNTTIKQNPSDELFIPNVVGELLTEDACSVKVMKSEDKWYGVTYHDDKPMVQKAFGDLIASGVYPENLWG